MNHEEYKNPINERNVLSHTTLNVTIKELSFGQEFELAEKIKHILNSHQIPKPKQHATHQNTGTDYYKVDLAPADIEKITDLFFDLESSHVTDDGEQTPTASFYASLADAWNELI